MYQVWVGFLVLIHFGLDWRFGRKLYLLEVEYDKCWCYSSAVVNSTITALKCTISMPAHTLLLESTPLVKPKQNDILHINTKSKLS